jgi:hypothetical protein
MAAGFEVYNADGSVQFNLGNRLFRTLTVQTTAGSAGSVTIPGASSQGTIRAVGVLTDAGDDAVPPALSVSGDTVSWGAGGASRIQMMVM